MKLRKTVSLILALILALSLAVPSFAATTYTYDATDGEVDQQLTANGYEFNMPGTLQDATVRVIFTKAANSGVILNPYEMTVDATRIGLSATERAQVISKPQYVKNLSDANLSVQIVATTSQGTGTSSTTSTVTYATAPVDQTKPQAKKTVFLYVETKIGTTQNADDVLAGNPLETPAGQGTQAVTFWNNGYVKKEADRAPLTSQGVLTSSTKGVTLDAGVLKAAAAPSGQTATPGDISNLEPVNGGILIFKVDGNCARELTAGTAWAATDAVNVKLAFTFTVTGEKASIDPAT